MFWRRARWHAVAKVGELAPGALIAVEVEGIALALGRDGDRYFAVQRQCVHRGSDLTKGFIASHQVVCPQHGWRFSTETGVGGMHDACLAMHDVRLAGEHIEIDARPRKRR
jgi:3-phenylpropionate/trans-cinnamate dioxygenase ferredoxin subunit